MHIRRAVTAEVVDLEALQWRASLSNPSDRNALMSHPEAIALPVEQIAAGQVFVAEDDDTILGVAVAIPRDNGDYELDGLFVEPGLWKRGVGKALVGHACDYARAEGASALHVIGNPQAEGFYLACGFVITGTYETQFGPGLLMQRKL